MEKQFIFNLKTDISRITIPDKLNNPFEQYIPEIGRIAATEFQEFITNESKKWKHDFHVKKGKMFGILVVQKQDKTYGYLGTISGKLPENDICNRFTPSVFDDSVDNFFINRGMSELSRIGSIIKTTTDKSEILLLKEKSKQKSISLQKRLFENYVFSNISGNEKNILDIFEDSSHGNPPSAAGECAAPKLLHFAIKNDLKPIAVAEFWWGNPLKNKEREHSMFYPACKNRCRPILEYMLENTELFIQSQ